MRSSWIAVCIVGTFFTTAAANAAVLPAPTGVYASQGVQQTGIGIGWDAVNGATSYQIAVYKDLTTSTRISTISIGVTTFHINTQPCGVYYYYEVAAVDNGTPGVPSARVFGYSPPCGEAVQSCDFKAIPLSGTGTYSFSTVGSINNYRIGDRTGPCTDGNDPGTGGVGPDQVYTYRSPVDCTLTVTLTPEIGYLMVLYVASTCENYACDYYNFTPSGSDSVTVSVTAGQSYYIFVDGYNGQSGNYTLDLSSGDCTAETSCADPTFGFENDALPEGWSVFNNDALAAPGVGRYAIDAWGALEDLAGSGYNHVIAAYANPAVAETSDDWLIAGPFDLGADSTLLWRDARFGNSGTPSMLVYVALEPTIQAFVEEGSVATLESADFSTTYTTRSVPLAGQGWANQTVYVAFRHRGLQSGYLLLDDIGICGAAVPTGHSSDQDDNGVISLSELLRVIQFYNTGALQCGVGTEDGFAPGAGSTACTPHASDYSPQNWIISLSELLRLIQFYNFGAYHACQEGEDGYCPGVA